MRKYVGVCIIFLLIFIMTIATVMVLNKKQEETINDTQNMIQIETEKTKEYLVANNDIDSYAYSIEVENDYLVIYSNETHSIFLNTNISYSNLPKTIQNKIDNKIGFETEAELYDFLENYSS